MERRQVATLGVTWLCWMLTISPGLPASPVTYRTKEALKIRQEASEEGSTALMTPSHLKVKTSDIVVVPLGEEGEDCACDVSLGYGQSTVVAEATRTAIGYQGTVYYSAKQDFTGVTLLLSLAELDMELPITNNICLSGPTWKKLYFEAYCALSNHAHMWYLSVHVDSCVLYSEPQEQCNSRTAQGLKLTAHGPSCWRATTQRCPSLTEDTEVRSPSVTRFPSYEGDTTQLPPQDGGGDDEAWLTSQDCRQVGSQQVTIFLAAGIPVLLLLLVVVFALIRQLRVTSQLRAAGEKSGAVSCLVT